MSKRAQNQKRRQWSRTVRKVLNPRKMRGYCYPSSETTCFIPMFAEIHGPLVVGYSRYQAMPARNYSFPFTKRRTKFKVNRYVRLGTIEEET